MTTLSAVKGYENCLEISNSQIKADWLSFCEKQGYQNKTWSVDPIAAMCLAIVAHFDGNTVVTNFMLSQIYCNWGNVIIDVELRLYYDFDDEGGCSAVPRKID